MPTIVVLTNCKIQMFADDHAPPHVHLYGPNSNAQIALSSLTVFRGQADRRDFEEAVTWMRANALLLRQEWRRLNER